MKFKLPEGALPTTLRLSPLEVAEITQEAQHLVAETIDAYEEFVHNRREFPHAQWKLVKTRDALSVYRTRSDHFGAAMAPPQRPHFDSAAKLEGTRKRNSRYGELRRTAISTRSTSASPPDYTRDADGIVRARMDSAVSARVQDAARPPKTPIVVVTGAVPGTVEDTALGNLADSNALCLLRGVYLEDERDEVKILTTILRPTQEDPFRFLGVKWSTRKFALLTRRRDLLYVESSGVVRDPITGRITDGYYIMHSIDIPRVPDLLARFNIVRVRLSLCFIATQHDANSVELYCRGFSVGGGGMMQSVAMAGYAELLLAAKNVVECAYVKKLIWLTQQRRSGNVHYTTQTVDTATHCHLCTKSFRGLSGLLRSPCVCQCCKRVACPQCSIDKRLVVDITCDEITQRSVPFCVQCVDDAKRLPAIDVASANVTHLDSYY